MRSVAELVEHVRGQGGKATSQRILIWTALAQDRTHPTAEDVYQRLKPALPSLALATVYHVLNELVEWGEIRRFDSGDGHTHFDPNTESHAELVCMRCHTIVDAPASGGAAPPIPHEIAGFRIVTRSEQYFGFCLACQQALGRPSGDGVAPS